MCPEVQRLPPPQVDQRHSEREMRWSTERLQLQLEALRRSRQPGGTPRVALTWPHVDVPHGPP